MSHTFDRSRRKLWVKAAWSSITAGPYVCGKTTGRGSLSHRFSCTLELFSFSKKYEPQQDCSSILWLFELCRPSQFAPTATVLNFTRRPTESFLHLGSPAAADSPAAPGWAGEVLHRSIPTSTYRNFDFFFECLTKVRSSFSPFEFAPTNEGIEPSNIRLSPSSQQNLLPDQPVRLWVDTRVHVELLFSAVWSAVGEIPSCITDDQNCLCTPRCRKCTSLEQHTTHNSNQGCIRTTV